MLRTIENALFRLRAPILVLMAIFTIFTGYYAVQLRLEAGFLKQLPLQHPYMKTFFEYQNEVPGANLVLIAVRARDGNVWQPEVLARTAHIAETVSYLPGVNRSRVSSLWAPSTSAVVIDEYGVDAKPVIGRRVTPDSISEKDLEYIREQTIAGGYLGLLVSNAQDAALVVAEIQQGEVSEEGAGAAAFEALELAAALESEIRDKYEDEVVEIHIIGFTKFMGEIAEGAYEVVWFFLAAFLLTGLSVFLYVRSLKLTILAIGCSLVSVIWQFGIMQMMGLGLDPLAILIPFLVYAIGVSHGVQQINLIATQISKGHDGMTAARHTFSRLLLPGSMALITDLVGFVTLTLLPVGIVQEMAIIATLGVGLKIITNLIMLPLIASYISRDDQQVRRFIKARYNREQVMKQLARVAEPRNSAIIVVLFFCMIAASMYHTRNRHIGDLTPGVSELSQSSRYNQDTAYIVDAFNLSTDVLIVVTTTPEDACIDPAYMSAIDDFAWFARNLPGVNAVDSLPGYARYFNAAFGEGNLKWSDLPSSRDQLVRTTSPVDPYWGVLNEKCTVLPVLIYMTDHKAETIETILAAIEEYKVANPLEGLDFRLAMGGVGVIAATNEIVEEYEFPLIAYVFAAIIILVFFAYRDWRAVVCCCMPLLLATFLGYSFMVELGIGLKLTTLPVLVLATGIGVDYAFYLYSQIQSFLRHGLRIEEAYTGALLSTGVAVVYTAITLAIGVATWSFSSLQFQADMGMLLAFMFFINMICAITILPALATVLDRLFPRSGQATRDSVLAH